MMLDVVVQYEYWGHRGKAYVPPAMHKAERRLRITVDDTKTVVAIRDEVLQRKEIIPKPYQFLGSTTKTGSGFELDEKDLVRHVSLHFEEASSPPPPLPHTRTTPTHAHTPKNTLSHALSLPTALPSLLAPINAIRLPPVGSTCSSQFTTARTPARATPAQERLHCHVMPLPSGDLVRAIGAQQ